jgi:murein tripeptide amidase MpaA
LNEQKLNDYISWYVIPMVNIDGVIVGNNRTGILGHDFNRNWVLE